jgi:cytochrome d ubiquinol oxidase subunit I
MTAELLSRIQFAFTMSFHILFPAFSIGLATFLAIMEACWLKTKNPLYLNICKFWTKIFALTFGMGIISGIVMEFQLGTNWAHFTAKVGPVLGSLFVYEVMTAFFIEAGFLGVMIFGWNKVGPKLHYAATLLVAIGVTISAFWILSANSWMQTPAGATIINGSFQVTDWTKVIFNPLFLPSFFHMLLASYLTTLFVIAGLSAFYLRKNIHLHFAKKCFSFAMWGILILIPLQIWVGDEAGLKVHEYQPMKTAAIEGLWQTQKGAPFLIFALPSPAAQKNEFSIGVPHLASLINTHEWNGEIQGLSTVPRADQPYVPVVFFTFRIMVGAGVLMFFIGGIGLWLRLKKRLYKTNWFLTLCTLSSPIGFIAILTGWFTTEVGRQPWIVNQLIRTKDAISPITNTEVAVSFILLAIIYGIIFGVFYFRYLGRVIHAGPAAHANKKEGDQPFSYMPVLEDKK